MINLFSRGLLLAAFLALLLQCQSASTQTNVPVWQRYDQSGDIALLAQHENDSMHFQVLQSQYLDKNELFQPFNAALAELGETRYQELKPLILDQPITALQSAVASGALSYEELTTFYLYRIREIEFDRDRYLNGVISLNPEAIARARELDRQRSSVSGDSIYGMPVLLKDNVGFAGLPTTAGAVALANNVTADAFITERLEANGAIILGKANMSEWAYFFCDDCPSGWTALGGQTLNPYGRFQFGTGGSSSGSGATMAANYAAAAVGSETSGSILSPSSANSLVGLKPTTGSLSRSGIVPISATLDTAGPMARSVHDTVIMFNAMAGYDARDRMMRLGDDGRRLQYRQRSLNGQRLGVLDSFAENEFYTAAAALLESNGATVVDTAFSQTGFDGFGEFLGIEMVR
ncbi:MAG: amidase family protein, partial [Gammaproteobacteria bacterium]